jgi:hypothetical protein
MLVVETIGRIRREHFVKGRPIKEIVRELRVSRNTVRKVLRSGATSIEYLRGVQPRPNPSSTVVVAKPLIGRRNRRPVSGVARQMGW